MARYDHLPIYKKAMEMLVFIENAVRGFSRYGHIGVSYLWTDAQWAVLEGDV